MCYKTSNSKPVSVMEERYNIKRDPNLDIEDNDFVSHHINGFTFPPMLIIGMDGGLDICPKPDLLHPALWGIIKPQWDGKDINDYYKSLGRYTGAALNAQSEKAFEYWLYKNSIMTKRCIVPVTGFFEPHKLNKNSYPFYFERKDEKHLSIAGIYTITKSGFVSFTLLTKAASPLFAAVHNKEGGKRQVVLLDESNEKDWLNPDLNEKDIQSFFNEEYDDKSLVTYPVSKDLNARKFHLDGEDAITKVDYPELEHINNEVGKLLT